jgi:hypothetical protein
MAIDWGRVAMGVGTGYLGAKIANTEANDKMNANIIERAGLNFYEIELPEWQKSEKNRKIAYGKISTRYGPGVAEYMGQNNFITGDGNDLQNIQNMLSERGISRDKLKAMVDQESTYKTRYESRAATIQDREKTIMGLTSGSSKIGNMTAELLLDKQETMTDAIDVKPVEYETITTPGKQVEGAPITTATTTEKFPISFSTGTYAFDELFPKSKSLDLEISEVRQLNSEAEKSFKRNIIRKAGGVEMVPANSKYLIGYKESGATDKTKYAMDIYKKEYIDDIINQYSNSVTEGKQASTYAIPPGTKVSDIVIQARAKIAELETKQYTEGDSAEPYIEQVKSVVREQLNLMNLEPSDFGF